jgi:uncharacterized protein (TIGR02246 family)
MIAPLARSLTNGGASMTQDERNIRDWLDGWWQATRSDDLDGVLGLMADDVVFLTLGREPFGKAEFVDAARSRSVKVDGRSEIDELEIAADWAWLRTHIEVTMTATSGEVHHRAGSTLSILRKEANGR